MDQKLFSLEGKYEGNGVNHEGQEFTGTFVVAPVKNKGLSVSFEAVGKNNEVFHSEYSLIGKNMSGEMCLWVLSTNHPGVFERKLTRQDSKEDSEIYLFGFGNVNDKASFREEILLEVQSSAVRYTYYWGMPGGEFAERSGCTMHLT